MIVQQESLFTYFMSNFVRQFKLPLAPPRTGGIAIRVKFIFIQVLHCHCCRLLLTATLRTAEKQRAHSADLCRLRTHLSNVIIFLFHGSFIGNSCSCTSFSACCSQPQFSVDSPINIEHCTELVYAELHQTLEAGTSPLSI
jgi:hypothetical protein